MILLVDNYDSFTYNLYQLLAQFDEVCVVRNDKVTAAEIERLAPRHVVISPGPGIPANAGNCADVIKHCSEHNIPLLGVCLGHQAIVEVFGGVVVVSEKPMHGKETNVFHHRQGLYEGMQLPFRAGRYHSLHAQRDKLPDCLVVESDNGDGMIMGVRHKTKPIYGLQFHPESILTPEGHQLIRNFIAQ